MELITFECVIDQIKKVHSHPVQLVIDVAVRAQFAIWSSLLHEVRVVPAMDGLYVTFAW